MQGIAGHAPVASVQGRTGSVVLALADVTGAAAVHTHSTSEVSGLTATIQSLAPVASVQGRTGSVVLTLDDVTAAAASHSHVAADVTDFATAAALYGPVSSINALTGAVTIEGGANVTVTTAGSSITIAAGGGGGGNVASVNGQIGTVVLSVVDVTAAAATHASQHETGGADVIKPVTLTVAEVTAAQSNWNIGVADIYYIRSGITNTINVTGIATAADNSARLLINVSTHTGSSFTLKHSNASSAASLQLLVPWAGDYVLSPNGGAALIVRSENNDKWRVV